MAEIVVYIRASITVPDGFRDALRDGHDQAHEELRHGLEYALSHENAFYNVVDLKVEEVRDPEVAQ